MKDNRNEQDKKTPFAVSATSDDPQTEAVIVDAFSQILDDLRKTETTRFRDTVAQQMAINIDPDKNSNKFNTLYQSAQQFLPPEYAKQIRNSEELIGGIIIPTRARQMSLFARPRANRFDVGFTFTVKPDALKKLSEQDQKELTETVIPKLNELILNCGSNIGLNDKEKSTFSQFMFQIVEDALTFGAFATEVIYNDENGFHSFRARDTGTIKYVQKKKEQSQEAKNLRIEAIKMLREVTGQNIIDPQKYENDDYTYVQVINDRPRQAFTDKELIYWSMNPSTDILRNDYPVSPMERILQSITTHINLTTTNKMFFINGRSYKNMIVFKSEDAIDEDLEAAKQQMYAHINTAANAHRMPVFALKSTDEIEVVSIDPGARDAEFQYLSDLNKRMIFAAYQMSPDEVSALGYLSRGTNSQSLAESNNQWKIEAARDTGIRPLLMSVEDFVNERLLPLINKEWSKVLRFNLEGIDADSPEKEATRLQQDAALHLTTNEILETVQKDPVPLFGDVLLNPQYIQILERYVMKGQILETFGGEKFKGYSERPDLQYYIGDPMYMQFLQMKQQSEMQQQQMQMQQSGQVDANGQPIPPQDPNDPQGGGQAPPADGQDGQQQDPNAQPQEQQPDLNTAIGQLQQVLGKSETTAVVRKAFLNKHSKAKAKILKDLEENSEKMKENILAHVEAAINKTEDDSLCPGCDDTFCARDKCFKKNS